MGISEILHKNNPMQKKIDRENRSDFAKLVDRNTELVDEIKWLKADNDILKERIDKAINILELSSQNKGICTRPETDTIQSALLILKGSDKE